MQEHVTSSGIAILSALAVAVALIAARVSMTARAAHVGWNVIAPGPSHWFGFLGCAAFALLTAWVWLYVGSARRDAAQQMVICFWLSAGMGLFALIGGANIVAIRRQGLRWRDGLLAYEGADGMLRTLAMADFDAIRRTWAGAYELRFADGTVVAVDPLASGSDAFMRELFARSEPQTGSSLS